jgi:tetratricopeptide (TPR) repeat protein
LAIAGGHAELVAGRSAEAADKLEEGLAIARRLGDDGAEAEALGYLAQAYLRLEAGDEAARCASEALAIAKARGDRAAAEHFRTLLLTARSSPAELEMSTSFGDGRSALLAGEVERAIPLLERALELADEVGHEVAAGASTQLLAEAFHAAGRLSDAERLLSRAKELARVLGDEAALARAEELGAKMRDEEEPLEAGIAAALEWGQKALAEGDIEQGIRLLERARDQARAEGQEIPEASAAGLLAQAYLEADRRDEAIASATRALALAESVGHEGAIADFRGLLEITKASPESHALAKAIQQGSMALEIGELAFASEKLELALELAKKTKQVVAEALASGLLATLASKQGDQERAIVHTRRALEISEARGEVGAVEHFRKLLAELSPQDAE